ncbi:fumarylacetoacetate hydrolase family protein [Actinoplanes sp. Pm04-4]|uniref:Fumarylacetoacetate hydrolase family protein n=1 Tax=Paractinoplanes pyxinae TaxID=2997416 RepID=A0ABT4B542_9ACTN|nr:fumarylacetoacetate hydrolase family protein [Actinoplanes pyxinae]MCY1141623.1 fumarylacetoacetate hydrolase family protein [Actinoplanes pyxinae]
MTHDPVAAAFGRLRDAAATGTPCTPVRDLIDDRSAYAVQQMLTRARLHDGHAIAGRKIGLTSPAVQRQLGVDRPDYGVLFDDMARAQYLPIATDGLLQPRVEAEVAFVLAVDVLEPDRIREHVAYAVAALEIVDSRIANWDITFADTVADNGSSALYVLGDHRVTLDHFEPRDVLMTMTADGRTVSEGSGQDCLGDPLHALAWLARTALEHGEPLRAGQIVLSGALGPMIPVAPGLHVRAQITGLGTVEASFAKETR